MSVQFAAATTNSIPIHAIDQDDLENWTAKQTPMTQTWVASNAFSGGLHQALVVPSPDGSPLMALAGYGNAKARKRSRFHLAGAAGKLPEGAYHIASGISEAELPQEALGWLLNSYRFDRYKSASVMKAQLIAPAGVDTDEIIA